MDLISTRWCCARCGAAYIGTPPETGICNDCTVVSLREIFYGAARLTLTQDQADCLAGMLADATAYRNTQVAGCPACMATADCPEHEADRARIEAYCQLVTNLTRGRQT